MNQFTFYLIVGILGACIDLVSFFVFQKIGLSILFSQWLAAFIGNTHNHFWQYFKIFDHNQTFYKTYVFSLILGIILILLSGPVVILFDAIFNNLIIAKLITFPLIGLIGYFIRKWFIYTFKEPIY